MALIKTKKVFLLKLFQLFSQKFQNNRIDCSAKHIHPENMLISPLSYLFNRFVISFIHFVQTEHIRIFNCICLIKTLVKSSFSSICGSSSSVEALLQPRTEFLQNISKAISLILFARREEITYIFRSDSQQIFQIFYL